MSTEEAPDYLPADHAPPSLGGPNESESLEAFSEPSVGLSEGTEPMFVVRADATEETGPADDSFMAYQVESTLSAFVELAGFIATAVVDIQSGHAMGTVSVDDQFDIVLAAAANNEVVRAKLNAVRKLGLGDAIEDILITLDSQYHLIRPLHARPDFFFYLALDRRRANLAMARIIMTEVERSLDA